MRLLHERVKANTSPHKIVFSAAFFVRCDFCVDVPQQIY